MERAKKSTLRSKKTFLRKVDFKVIVYFFIFIVRTLPSNSVTRTR